jgi:hypothetical protein
MKAEFTSEIAIRVDDGTADYPYGDRTGTAKVRWELNLTLRDWGVKDFWIHVPPQKITVFMSEEGEDGTPDAEVTYEITEDTYVSSEVFAGEPLPQLRPEELRREAGKWTIMF